MYLIHSERKKSYFEFRGCCGAFSKVEPSFDKDFITNLTCTRQEDFDDGGGYMSTDVNTCCCRGDL